MSGKIHYEVFFKKNKKAGWALIEACPDRDSALKLATGLVTKHKDGSARVTKEKYDEDSRSFRAVTVYEAGAEKYGAIEEKSSDAHLPCLTPDDLSKPHARDTIRRVLTGWLERVQAVPMELLHRADLVEDLEASGTDLQHAVQKVAVASARDSRPGDGRVLLGRQAEDLAEAGSNHRRQAVATSPPKPAHVVAEPVCVQFIVGRRAERGRQEAVHAV